MALPTPPADPTDWSARIGAKAFGMMNATISVFEPVEGTYDPESDTAASEPTLLFTSVARVQHMRWGVDASTAQQWNTSRAIRIQVPLDASTALIRKGLLVRVISGANDVVLEKVALEVISAINSSHAAVRTIECVSPLNEAPAVAVVP